MHINQDKCSDFVTATPSYQPYLSGQQIVHHALLEFAGFGEAGFEGGNLGVHVGEDGGDGGLFVGLRKSNRHCEQGRL